MFGFVLGCYGWFRLFAYCSGLGAFVVLLAVVWCVVVGVLVCWLVS